MSHGTLSLGADRAGVVARKHIARDGLTVNNLTAFKENDMCKSIDLMGSFPNAIILAAGSGIRMAPIGQEQPKGLLEVHGEPLIERLVKQLHEMGITDITVVIGYMAERFSYLADKYRVQLVENAEWAAKNNLASLALVADRLHGTYVIPCDVWCELNPFEYHGGKSWYMVNDIVDDESDVRVTRKGALVRAPNGRGGNSMVGISYLDELDSAIVTKRLLAMSLDDACDNDFWEEALWEGDEMLVSARVVSHVEVVEIDTYEQLRDLDGGSGQLRSSAIDAICDGLCVGASDISGISVLKKGMTNRSFLFSANGMRYIMRVPGEGTDRLINRVQEAEVYRTVAGRGLCDDPVYLDPDSGYKITRFLDGVRTCNPEDEHDLERCISKLRDFHGMRLQVSHVFDCFERIEFYESLWDGSPSEYLDYAMTKAKVLSLRSWVESRPHEWCLTHIDAVPDNFLFYPNDMGGEDLQLTDWEYAGMQDPHVDIAMFAIYSLYDKAQIDRLIDLYFAEEGGCEARTRAKIYCYIAICGLLWSNWCEYKRNLGVEFGEYSTAQYQYAKDFYRYALELAPDAACGEAQLEHDGSIAISGEEN